MKKTLTILLLLISSSVMAVNGLVEAKFSYFYPSDTTTRDIFDGGVQYRLEGTLCCDWCFKPWVSVGYIPLSGHTVELDSKTRLRLVPIGAGLKYFRSCQLCDCCFDIYAGAGILTCYAKTCNDDTDLVSGRSKWGVGGIFQLGIMKTFCQCYFFDLFADYQVISFDYDKKGYALGRNGIANGANFGLGVGRKF